MQTGVLKSGKGKAYWVVGDLYTVLASGGPGTWVTLAKGSLHTFRNNGSTTATMLIVVTPAGLERFFAEIGHEAIEGVAAPAVTPADIEKLLAVAPKYGIEIRPPG